LFAASITTKKILGIHATEKRATRE